MQKGLGKNTKTGGNPSYELYVLRVLNQISATLISILANQGSKSQYYVATAGQTTFPTLFTPLPGRTHVTENGQVIAAGWSIVGDTIEFDLGRQLNSEIVIYLI